MSALFGPAQPHPRASATNQNDTAHEPRTRTKYVYDANGQRVQKTSSSGTVSYVYDLAAHQVAEFNSSGGWNRGEVYAGGRHLAAYANSTTYFIHPDWLGTERARSTVAGTTYETCTSLPFGDWLTCSGGDPSPMHFTGKPRDTESNLDYFGARYDSSQLGRFMSPDPKIPSFKHIVNPQKWNRYAYALDNPLIYLDPDGAEEISLKDALKKIISAFKVKVEGGVGAEYGAHLGTLKGKVGAAVKGEVEVSSKGVGVKAVAEVGGEAKTPIGNVGLKPGAEVQTMKDSNGIPLKDQHVELKSGVSVGSEKTEVKGDTGGDVGLGLTVSADGAVLGFDISANTGELSEGFGELAVILQQTILQQVFPGALSGDRTPDSSSTTQQQQQPKPN